MSKILEVSKLYVVYPDGTRALDGISFEMEEGKILGVVGESGSGKTTLALSLLGLLPSGSKISGRINYRGINILELSQKELSKVRGKEISLVFQDALSAFDPLQKVGKQIVEKSTRERELTYSEARLKAISLMRDLGVNNPELRFSVYPHELSGGLRQRMFIAMSLFENPKLLIMDEPTTALDVITQAQLVEMISSLKKRGLSIIFITHDLALASSICDSIMVMYAGKVVEIGTAIQITSNPLHPYTMGLLESTPSITRPAELLKPMKGSLPNMRNLPRGCRFHPRCPYATEICKQSEPNLTPRQGGRLVACHLQVGEDIESTNLRS
ncbi:MAG: ABC transporter ATP-binding protein [Thermoprotei archaeon]